MPFQDRDLPCARSNYQCFKCKRNFVEKESFLQHLRNSAKHKALNETQKCVSCVRVFSNKRTFIEHLQHNRHHSSDLHHAACTGKYYALGRFLLTENANEPGQSHLDSSKSQTGHSPMHCAAFGGHYECLKIMLCWQDGDPNVVDQVDNRTPVHLAAWKGHARCLKLLLSSGGDLEAKDSKGDTPLTLCKDAHCFTVIMYSLAERAARTSSSYQSLGESLELELCQLLGKSKLFDWPVEGEQRICTLETNEVHRESLSEPYEVLARGQTAVRIFNNALSEGKARVSQVQLAVLGDVGAGKTSLVRTLSGQDFVQDRLETHGIDTSMVETTELNESWHLVDLNKSHLDEILADIVCKGVKTQCRQTGTEISAIEQPGATAEEGGSHSPLFRLPSIEWEPTTQGNPESIDKESETAFSTVSEITCMTQQTPKRDMPVDQIIRRLSCSSLQDKETKLGKISIWDFAGHPLYRTMHHVFLNRRFFYLVVLNLVRLSDPKTSEEEIRNVRFWLNSVRVHTPHTTPIFLVGTHRDTVGEEATCKAEKQTHEEFAEMFGQQLVKSKKDCFLFAVENVLGLEDKGAVALMKAIEQEVYQLVRNEEELPIRWLHFEEQIVKYRKSPEHRAWVTRNFLKELMIEHCGKVDEIEFDSMLHFYHDSGVIILPEAVVGPESEYPSVKELVVVNPQYLVDIMTCLHDIPNSSDVNRQYRALWTKLQEQGIANVELLEHAWQSFLSPAEDVLGILEAVGMLCPVQECADVEDCSDPPSTTIEEMKPGTKKFIVPIHLKERCLRRTWEKHCRKSWKGISTSDKVLIFDFHTFLPPALFPYFIVRTAAKSKETNGMHPIITKHMAIFSFGDNFFVLVELEQQYNQIKVRARNKNGKALPQLFFTLKTIMTEICQQNFKFLKFVLGPACPNPQCPGSSMDGKVLSVSSSEEESDVEDDSTEIPTQSKDKNRQHVIPVDPTLFEKPLWCNRLPVHEFEEIRQWVEEPQKCVTTITEYPLSSMQVKQCCLVLVAKAMANEWKWLGRILEVPDTTINSIQKENIESQDEQSYQVLDKWFNANGSDATVDSLMKAIKELDAKDALEKFNRHVAERHF